MINIHSKKSKLHGLFLAVIIAILALVVSSYVTISAVVLAIFFGLVVANSIKLDTKYHSGINFGERQILYIAISLMGINMNWTVLHNIGWQTLFLIVLSIVFVILFAMWLSKLLSVDKKLSMGIAIGSAICGTAAISATKDILKLDKSSTAIAIGTINLLGTFGAFLLPTFSLFLFDDINTGILIGNTIQGVGQAVASGFMVSYEAGQTATIVKMARVAMLTPLVLLLLYMLKNKTKTQTNKTPWFIYGFLGFSILSTFSVLPEYILQILSYIGNFTLVVALGCIGLGIDIKDIAQNGLSGLKLGLIVFVAQILFTTTILLF